MVTTTRTNLIILIKVSQYGLCRLQSPINILMGFPNRMCSDLQNQTQKKKKKKKNTTHSATTTCEYLEKEAKAKPRCPLKVKQEIKSIILDTVGNCIQMWPQLRSPRPQVRSFFVAAVAVFITIFDISGNCRQMQPQLQ